MTRTLLIITGAGLILAVNLAFVIVLVVADLLKEFRERKALRKLPATSVAT
jgi:hypothetical protein